MDKSLEILLAEREIERALRSYSHGVLSADAGAMLSAYHPGATERRPDFEGLATDFVARSVGRQRSLYRVITQYLTNIDIEWHGDIAHVESFVLSAHITVDESKLDWLGGRFRDRFDRRNGEWKIASRELVAEWSHSEPLTTAYGAPRDPS